MHDTTVGWRFVDRLTQQQYGVDSMPETAENGTTNYKVECAAQGRRALARQPKAVAAQNAGHLAREITPVSMVQKKGDPLLVTKDEHPRETSLEALSKLKGVVPSDGTVTAGNAGNASGVNDSAFVLLASEQGAGRHGPTPGARVLPMARAGVAARVMGIGPAPARRKVPTQAAWRLNQIAVIKLDKACAAQRIAFLHDLGPRDDDEGVHARDGAIAPGGPPGRRRRSSGDDLHEPAVRDRRSLRAGHDVVRRRSGPRVGE